LSLGQKAETVTSSKLHFSLSPKSPVQDPKNPSGSVINRFGASPLSQLLQGRAEKMAPKKCKGTELSVFKGREARLNRAIFQVLSAEAPQAIWDIFKGVTKL